MKTPGIMRALATLRRCVPGKLSSASIAITLSVLAHAAGLWLMPGWQRTEASTQAAAPEPLRLRLQVREAVLVVPPPPAAKPERTASTRPAASSRAAASPPAQAQAETPEERKPDILSVHRDAPPARPISPPGDSAPSAARVAEHVHGLASPPVTAADKGGIAGEELLALASTRAEPAKHSDVAYLHNPKPAYPPMARRLGIEGTVMLRILVGGDGTPEQSRIIASSGTDALDAAALEAVRRWRFVPARDGRAAIAHWVDVPISFKLGVR